MNSIQILLAAALVITLGLFSWKKPRLSSIIIWSTVATILLTSAALIAIPGDFQTKALWLSLSVPITWVGLQYLCYWAESEWKVLGGLLATSLLSTVLIFNVEIVI